MLASGMSAVQMLLLTPQECEWRQSLLINATMSRAPVDSVQTKSMMGTCSLVWDRSELEIHHSSMMVWIAHPNQQKMREALGLHEEHGFSKA